MPQTRSRTDVIQLVDYSYLKELDERTDNPLESLGLFESFYGTTTTFSDFWGRRKCVAHTEGTGSRSLPLARFDRVLGISCSAPRLAQSTGCGV